MHVICEALIIGAFVGGTLFGHWVARNGCVVITAKETDKEKADKNSMERQWAEMMSYDGNARKGERWKE